MTSLFSATSPNYYAKASWQSTLLGSIPKNMSISQSCIEINLGLFIIKIMLSMCLKGKSKDLF